MAGKAGDAFVRGVIENDVEKRRLLCVQRNGLPDDFLHQFLMTRSAVGKGLPVLRLVGEKNIQVTFHARMLSSFGMEGLKGTLHVLTPAHGGMTFTTGDILTFL